MTSKPIKRTQDTVEYLHGTVTAETVLTDEVTVEFAVIPGLDPSDDDYVAGEWAGAVGTSRDCRTLAPVGPLERGVWNVFVRCTAPPEVPVLRAGTVYVE